MSAADFFAPHDKLPRAWPGALLLSLLWLAVALFLTATHYLPTHDAIGWHGVYHYFAEVLGEGRFPWWNPYSRGGEPFFPHLQLLGLLQPSYLPFIALQKLEVVTSVTAYALHYFFQIYVLLLGTYLVVQRMTRNTGNAVLWSLIGLSALLPSIFMQNGIMNGCTYIPLMHYFLLRFLEEPGAPEADRRGGWLLAFAVAFAIQMNAWVPAPALLFLTSMAAGLLIGGRHLLRPALDYLRTKPGVRWMAFSLAVSALLVAPVAALFVELRLIDELFPLVRILQHNNLELAQCFASDLRSDLFSERFTNQAVVSLTTQNIAGLLFEPISPLREYREFWEMVFFVGTFTVLSAAFGLARARSAWKAAIVLLLLLSLFAALHVGDKVHNEPGLVQGLLRKLLPFLAMTDVAQILGALTVYALVLLAALGLSHFARSTLAMLTAILAPFAFKFYPDWGLLDRSDPLLWGVSAVVVAGLALAASRRLDPAARSHLRLVLALGVLAFEMYHFQEFYLVNMERAWPGYYRYLERSNLLTGAPDPSFRMRRDPYAFDHSDRLDMMLGHMANPSSFYGRDAMARRKSAFPNVLRLHTGRDEDFRRFPLWDNIFATRYYYDYLVNVKPARQLAYSGVTCPVVRVVSAEASAVARSPAEAAAALNSPRFNPGHVVLMGGYAPNAAAAQAADRCFARRRPLLAMTDADRADFDRTLSTPCPAGEDAGAAKVLRHDENNVLMEASAPAEGGFLYYADAYSRHWRAYVDGAETPIFLANMTYKAVRLPPGTHKVEFRYVPVLFRASVQLYYLGLALAAAALVWAMLRRTGRASSPSA